MRIVIGVSTQDACRLLAKLGQGDLPSYLVSTGATSYKPMLDGEATPFHLFLNPDGTWDMSAELEV